MQQAYIFNRLNFRMIGAYTKPEIKIARIATGQM